MDFLPSFFIDRSLVSNNIFVHSFSSCTSGSSAVGRGELPYPLINPIKPID